MIPATMENAARRLVRVGRFPRNKTANSMANNGVLLVKQDDSDAPSRSIPLKMKKRETPGTKMPMTTNIRFAGAQRSIVSEKTKT